MVSCSPRMQYLSSPAVIHLLPGLLFIINALVGISGNTMALRVFCRPESRKKTHVKLLLSLVVSDAFVSYVLCPMYGIQLIKKEMLEDCLYDVIRAYMHVIMTGVSTISLGIIACYRYQTISKVGEWNLKRSTVIALIFCRWIFSLSIPALRFVHDFVYITSIYIIIVAPLVTFTIFYKLLARVVSSHVKNIQATQTTSMTSWDDNKEENTKRNRYHISQIRIAKRVRLMVLCYVVCLLPVSVWMVINQIQMRKMFLSKKTNHLMYVITMFFVCMNSSINPVIYAFKCAEFKKFWQAYFIRIKKKT